jgi:S1-C subfamily serine protease
MSCLLKSVLLPITLIAAGLPALSSPAFADGRQVGQRQVQKTSRGSQSDQSPSQRAPYRLGVYCHTVEGGVMIDGLVSGGAAERIGLEVGDIIISIDGRPIEDTSDLYRALQRSGGFARLRIINVRDDSLVYRNVDLTR